MNGRKLLLATAIAGTALIAGACSIDVERNPDGSFQATGTLTEASLAAEMERDARNESVELDFAAGGVIVAAVERRDDLGAQVNTVEFTAQVGAVGGDLTVQVTEATFDGFPIPQRWLEQWNEELARGLRQAANEHPDATLETISVVGDSMVFEWRLETDESRDD